MSFLHHILRNDNVEIDLRILFDICDNDQEQILNLTRTFLNTSFVNINKLEQFFSTKDLNQLKLTAHRCRSSLSVFMYKDLYDLFIKIESLAKESNEVLYLNELIKEAIKKYLSMIDLLNLELNLNF